MAKKKDEVIDEQAVELTATGETGSDLETASVLGTDVEYEQSLDPVDGLNLADTPADGDNLTDTEVPTVPDKPAGGAVDNGADSGTLPKGDRSEELDIGDTPSESDGAASIVLTRKTKVYASPSTKMCIDELVGAVRVLQDNVPSSGSKTFSLIEYKLPGSGRYATGYIENAESTSGGSSEEPVAPIPEEPGA